MFRRSLTASSSTLTGFRLLPDVITSNTPPPSPLRRSHSCLAFFHDKTQAQTSLTPPVSSSLLQGNDAEVEAVEARLSHIHEVRRQVQSDASSTAHLPHLSWVLPRLPSPSRHPGDQREEEHRRGREDDESGERRRLWRHIGGDLRKMADQFQVNGSSVSCVTHLCTCVPLFLSWWWGVRVEHVAGHDSTSSTIMLDHSHYWHTSSDASGGVH